MNTKHRSPLLISILLAGSAVVAAALPQAAFGLQFSELAGQGNNHGIEDKVRSAFPDAPVMADVARCESGFRQFDSSGNPLRGGNGSVIGIFQINETSHKANAQAMGLDIYSVDGNISYARYLYDRQGTGPWMSAFSCWGAQTGSTPAPAAQPTLTKDLSFGMAGPEVKVLQQLLNRAGFTVAAAGPGSPGSETPMFGNLTRAAVRRFQCARGIVCSGDEYTSGFGLVNAATRAALVSGEASAPAVPATFALSRDLESGMQGEDVSYLQSFLQKQGLYSGAISGSFDAETRAAAIGFQKRHGITPQLGYVGPKTRAAMRSLLGS